MSHAKNRLRAIAVVAALSVSVLVGAVPASAAPADAAYDNAGAKAQGGPWTVVDEGGEFAPQQWSWR